MEFLSLLILFLLPLAVLTIILLIWCFIYVVVMLDVEAKDNMSKRDIEEGRKITGGNRKVGGSSSNADISRAIRSGIAKANYERGESVGTYGSSDGFFEN